MYNISVSVKEHDMKNSVGQSIFTGMSDKFKYFLDSHKMATENFT